MPVPIRVAQNKNIWVAAGDGDLVRVQRIGTDGRSSSYAGGDVNITDEDGDTPLYVVENVETARWLVEHGAVVDRRNREGQSPAAYLSEEFPEVAAYLETVAPTLPGDGAPAPALGAQTTPSQHAQNQASELLTSALMERVQEIMQRAEAEGRDPDDELRAVVGSAVIEGVLAGYSMTQGDEARAERDADEVKRARRDGEGPP
ncbi:hypothetical protein EIP86_007818 [Pleurotus ostreatoroseus]|nr:hypothetical protein EIP86_007818 [Pleurotus ostreatoroseus]